MDWGFIIIGKDRPNLVQITVEMNPIQVAQVLRALHLASLLMIESKHSYNMCISVYMCIYIYIFMRVYIYICICIYIYIYIMYIYVCIITYAHLNPYLSVASIYNLHTSLYLYLCL